MRYPLMKNKYNRDSEVKPAKSQDPKLTSGPTRGLKKWSEWLGVKYSVFVNSGSSQIYYLLGLRKIYMVANYSTSFYLEL